MPPELRTMEALPLPGSVRIVDGTARECTGVIAALEKVMRELPDGAMVCALVADVPSRIDVHAWAGRKGHAITVDRIGSGRFELTILKGGARGRIGSS